MDDHHRMLQLGGLAPCGQNVDVIGRTHTIQLDSIDFKNSNKELEPSPRRRASNQAKIAGKAIRDSIEAQAADIYSYYGTNGDRDLYCIYHPLVDALEEWAMSSSPRFTLKWRFPCVHILDPHEVLSKVFKDAIYEKTFIYRVSVDNLRLSHTYTASITLSSLIDKDQWVQLFTSALNKYIVPAVANVQPSYLCQYKRQ